MKSNKIIAISLLAGILAPSMAACSSNSSSSGTTYLRVLNSEDYIYVHEPENGYDEDDLIDQFADYIASDPELSAKYGKVEVIYDTADTMEKVQYRETVLPNRWHIDEHLAIDVLFGAIHIDRVNTSAGNIRLGLDVQVRLRVASNGNDTLFMQNNIGGIGVDGVLYLPAIDDKAVLVHLGHDRVGGECPDAS